MSADTLIPFAFEALPVRGALVEMRRSWRRMQRDHDYTPLIAETLGHAAAATGLIAHSLKFDGAITLQIQASGALQMLVMQCTSEHEMRGMAVAEDGIEASSFRDIANGAHCAITVDSGDRPYQGIVEMHGGSLAASLEHYFEQSVQVPSHLALLAGEDIAAGLLLQQMPGQAIDADDWNRLNLLAQTLAHQDFAEGAGLELIGKLFAEDDVRVFESKAVTFRCRCSGQKAEDVLRMLGETEAREALRETGQIEVVCEYCGRRRQFDSVDISRLFADNVVPAPDSVQ